MSEERAEYLVSEAGTERPLRKVVLSLSDGGASIGIELEGCDPYIRWIPEGKLADAITGLHHAIAQAQALWTFQARHPEYARPAGEASSPPIARTSQTPRPAPQTQANEPGARQNKLFD